MFLLWALFNRLVDPLAEGKGTLGHDEYMKCKRYMEVRDMYNPAQFICKKKKYCSISSGCKYPGIYKQTRQIGVWMLKNDWKLN